MMARLAWLAYRLAEWRWRLLRPIMLGVRLAPIQDGQVILVRHTYQPGWHFPGGALERGETPLEAALREAQEEAGVCVEATPELLGVYSSFREGKSDHVIVYVCSAFHLGEASDRWEIAERRAFPLDNLPSTVSLATRRRIEEYLAGNGPYSGRW
jgi:ADP-ribose pyrophosphatase YjhB (NUDIX family)